MQVHCRAGLSDTRRIDLLQSHVMGDASKIIHGLTYSGKNYAVALKELKTAFGHRMMFSFTIEWLGMKHFCFFQTAEL